MEPDPGTSLRPGRLRPVGRPRPAGVQAGRDGRPQRVQPRRGQGEPQRVSRIDESWRVVDEWWRAHPIVRSYHRLTLEQGHSLTLFHDDLAGGWFVQRY